MEHIKLIHLNIFGINFDITPSTSKSKILPLLFKSLAWYFVWTSHCCNWCSILYAMMPTKKLLSVNNRIGQSPHSPHCRHDIRACAPRLRHCPTSRKVAGSIPDGISRSFQWLYPSRRNMFLGSTQPLTKMSATDKIWRRTFMCRLCWNSGSLDLLESSVPVQTSKGVPLCLICHGDLLIKVRVDMSSAGDEFNCTAIWRHAFHYWRM
jgi:hypothetical protein